jgi:hypothetical protein
MIKRNFDKKVKSDVFKAGDMVLKWDAADRRKASTENLRLSGQVLL